MGWDQRPHPSPHSFSSVEEETAAEVEEVRWEGDVLPFHSDRVAEKGEALQEPHNIYAILGDSRE